MICRSKHVTQRCPDLWRRYHSTTGQDELNNTGTVLKPDHLLYCCNCSGMCTYIYAYLLFRSLLDLIFLLSFKGRGHLIHDCPEKRWSKYTPVNPTIVSYENPRDFLNKITNDGKSAISISEDRKEVWVVGNVRDKSPKKGGHQTYFFSLDQSASEHAMRTAKNTVLQEIKHVNIYWRKQLKKGRMLVEFVGNGDTKEAKNRFKKIVTFQKKKEASTSRRNNSAQGNAAPKNSTLENRKTTVANSITQVDINHMNRDGRQMRQHIQVNLTEKEKRNVGKMLGKFEFRHRVQITSCYMGKKWELTIHKLPNGNSSAAQNSIVQFLDSLSTRPVGA